LLVDDEEDILELFVGLFSDEGYHLYTASKAQEAIDIINRNTIDLVISDLKLPDASGIELLNHAKSKNPGSVRILTSGYLNVQFGKITESVQDGILYMSKPWDFTTLRHLISRYLNN